MSDNELDELLSQLKDACKKNRHSSSNEIHLTNILKKIDVFINRRQMKLLNHQKRLDDLQRDLLLSESERTQNRVALEKKHFEVNQLHMMLNKAEQTTQNIITNYDNEVQHLSKQLSHVQQEYDRLKTIHKTNQETPSMNDIAHLREFNKMLEIDNQRLNNENNQLKQTCSCEKNTQLDKLINSLQRSNQQPLNDPTIKTLENEIEFYKRRFEEQNTKIHRLEKQHKEELDNREQQCNLLRLELQRVQTEKEILKVRFIEQKLSESPTMDFREIDNNDYEKFIRNELETNIDQANRLINHWNSHKQILEEKIRQLTNERDQLKKENKTNNVNDLSKEMFDYNENILHAKRDMNRLQMEITDKNTIIYNLYKKIECLEQALMISNQRMNAQLNEITELRSRNSMMISSKKHIPIVIDVLSTDDDEGQIRQSADHIKNLCTSSPIKSADIHKYFHKFNNDSSLSFGIQSEHRKFLSR